MRHFETLSHIEDDTHTGILQITSGKRSAAAIRLAMRREGEYVVIAAVYGPFEIALRLRYDELARALARLQPVEGLQISRQVGTGHASLALGLQPDDSLLLRPTIIADATGHTSFNLALSPEARAALYRWLDIA